MSVVDRCRIEPLFIESASGRIFGMFYPPADDRKKAAVLFVPPFAEEMNRSRRMVALQARAFASGGIGTLLFDPVGTGDSAGEFREARLSIWLENLLAAANWLVARGEGTVWLWGLRLGALLACAAAASEPERFKHLLLWQPVTDGKSMLAQFLRIRVAAGMAEGKRESTGELRAQWAARRSIEIGGYDVAAELAGALDQMRIDDFRIGPGVHIHWLEVAAEGSDRLLPAGQRVIERWREAGNTVSAASVPGDPFWAVQETTIAPALIAATTRIVEGLST